MSEFRTFDADHIDLNGKSLLITGGTGSFGHCFVETILRRFKPSRLIVFSRDELKQFEMAAKFPSSKYPCIRYFIGDVRDLLRLELAMRGVDYVIHAAAIKHVSIAEYNPTECINTNVIGGQNVFLAAMKAGVKAVIALSTDKAANPINLYGASKLASDKIFIAANSLSGPGGTRYSVVRYGNVMGSRGSVMPLFRKLIDENVESLPITDPRMTRFWITITQGVNFVLACLNRMQGGEIFIPKIPSMNIVDLAKAMAPDLPHHTVGIRPGEKLHEVMVTQDDARMVWEYDDYYIIKPAFQFWSDEEFNMNSGVPVEETFMYTSDGNSEWLDSFALQKILELNVST
jgi:UDP-N-acetylglucosamine 4,6-dehydratase/5-epimerase